MMGAAIQVQKINIFCNSSVCFFEDRMDKGKNIFQDFG
jgi:hypothetical protein